MQSFPCLRLTSILVSAPFLCLILVQTVQAQDWAYAGANGPAQWGKLRSDYALCANGQKQSPVDIGATQKQNLPPIQFHYQPAPLAIVNDGHTVRVRFANGNSILVGKQKFLLQQMHFHAPSGDRIAGHEFELAIHFVHKSHTGQVAVIVVLLQLGQKNSALENLLPEMPVSKSREQHRPAFTIDPFQFIPQEKGYYAYEGSLTAPPCTEGIAWLILKQPMELSAEQFHQLTGFFPLNARPVQALHARVIKESR